MTSEPRRIPAAGMVEGRIVVSHPIGLHARPSVRLTQLARTFDSAIRLRVLDDGDWVDAKSIVRVMATKVKVGQTLLFRAEGADAARAVEALVALVERNFDENAAR
ncbi:MAG: HPr family phosphocarrier protein [Kiloniellaceae bacterium]